MIFIDWMSTPYHKNFNRAFFDSIKPINGNCYVFNPSSVVISVSPISLANKVIEIRDIIITFIINFILILCMNYHKKLFYYPYHEY